MALGFCTQWNLYDNLPADLIRKQDELAGPQSLAKRLNTNSNKVFTLFEALILSFIPLPIKNLFIKFMKAFL